MAEEWRRKAYYRTRVLIPVDEVLDSAFGDCLVCLTGGQLNLVRNLLLYAERRSTFVSEYEPTTYLAPTTEEWDNLQTVVADLEGNLMDCEQFTSDLQEILDWVRLQATLPGGSFSADELEAFPYSDEVPDSELTPEEEEACALSQLWYEWGYQTITEQVLPATRWGFDYLIPALTGFIGTAIGGPVAGLGAWRIAEFIQELMEIFYRGAETNLVNWMDTNKFDIVCTLFNNLVVGGDASVIWAVVEDTIITPAEDISAGDKLILHLFMGSWAGSNALLAFEAETEWSTDNVSAGYCDLCEPGPLSHGWVFPPDTNWDVTDEDVWYDDPGGWIVGQTGGAANGPTMVIQPDTYDISLYVRACDDGAGIRQVLYLQEHDGDFNWSNIVVFNIDVPTCPSVGLDSKITEDVIFTGPYVRYRWQVNPTLTGQLHEMYAVWTPA